MFKKSRILATLLLSISLLTACSNASNSYVGEWYSVENLNEYLALKSDGHFEIHQDDNIVQGEYSIKDNQLLMDFGYISGYFTIDTFDNINVIFGHMDDEIYAYGKENAEKLHDKQIDKEDVMENHK
ncbi:hypothetical protein AT54_01105 [Streptococcus equi subsp. zooepidemicus Sz12is]|uniref:hypothetical protein n=1 Tax=Streptococcus equi TaxID=1336 RepID=UPI0005B9E8E6|nr:hypothetical protein [Streptococcus equi]KIS05197.1 hypothetical protein AT54_01105 [Streptococcus equi subsp. zooepidemicus Sz12is]